MAATTTAIDLAAGLCALHLSRAALAKVPAGRRAVARLEAAEASGDPAVLAAASAALLSTASSAGFATAQLKARLEHIGAALRATTGVPAAQLEPYETAYFDLVTAVRGGLPPERYVALRRRTEQLAGKVKALR